MDGGRATVLRKQGSVQVDGAHGRAVPDQFRQHPKGHHHAKVGVPFIQNRMELRVLEFFRLGQGKAMGFSHRFDLAGTQRASSAGRSVGGRDDPDNLVTALQQPFKASGGEQGGSKKNDAQRALGVCHATKVRLKAPRSTMDDPAAREEV